MKLKTPLVAAFGLSIALSAPGFAQDADTVITSVGDVDITLGHVIQLRQSLPEQFQSLTDAQLFDGIVRQLVDQTLLAESVTGDMSLAVRLALENNRRQTLANSEIDRLLSQAVDPADVRAQFDEIVANLPEERQYEAAHILLETEAEALAVLAEIEGGADFAEVAMARSTGPSGPNGGALGWFGLGQMVPEFEAAVVAMTPGEVSGPVETQFGWHVIKLNDTRTNAGPSFEELAPRIEQQIANDVLREQIEALTVAAGVVVDLSGFDPALIRRDELLEE